MNLSIPTTGWAHALRTREGSGSVVPTETPYCTTPSLGPSGLTFLSGGDAWGVPPEGGEAQRIDFGGSEITALMGSSLSPALVATTHSGEAHQLLLKQDWTGEAKVVHSQSRPIHIAGWVSRTTLLLTFEPIPGLAAESAFELDVATALRTGSRWAPFTSISCSDGLLVCSASGVLPAEFTGYRGGASGVLWAGTSPGHLTQLTTGTGNPCSAVALAGRIWFVGDPDGYTNIYSRSMDSAAVTKHTDFRLRGLRDLKGGPRGLVFESEGVVWIIDVASGQVRPIDVWLPSSLSKASSPAIRVVPKSADLVKACESTGKIGVLRSGRLDFHEPNGAFLHSFPQKYGHVQAYSWAADGRIHIATSADAASQLQLWDSDAITCSLLSPPVPMDFRVEALASHSGGLAIATSSSEVLSLEITGNHVSGEFKVLERGAALRITDLHADPTHPYVAWVNQDNYSSKEIVVVNPATDQRGVINPAGQILQGPIIAPEGNVLYFLARQTSPISGTAAPSLSEPVLCALQLGTSSGQCLLSPDVRVLARRLAGVLSLTRTRGGVAAVTRSAVHMVWPQREQPFHNGEKFLGDSTTIAFSHGNETVVLGRSPVRLKADVRAWGTQADKQGLLDEVIHIARSYALHGADKEWPGPAALRRYQSSVTRSMTLADLAKVLRQLLGELGMSHTAMLDESPAASNFIDDRTLDCVSFFDGTRRWVTHGAFTSTIEHPPVPISAVNGAQVPLGVDPYSMVLPGPGPGTVTLVIPGEGSKEVSFSHASESNQWYDDEIRECIELVSAATQGTAQYLHLRDVAAASVQAVEQLCRGWGESSTLILDLRFNTGGPFADYLSAILQNLFQRRAVMKRGQEQNALLGGPSRGIVLINERTGSGGENLAGLLSRTPFVTLVGSRTFGAGTGFMRTHKLGSGLLMTVPEFELSTSHGQARIENHGLEPDVEIPKTSQSQRPLANTDLLFAVQQAVEGDYRDSIR